AARRLARRCCREAVRLQRSEARGIDIVTAHRKARVEQVARNRATHDAETDTADCGHRLLLLTSTSRACEHYPHPTLPLKGGGDLDFWASENGDDCAPCFVNAPSPLRGRVGWGVASQPQIKLPDQLVVVELV